MRITTHTDYGVRVLISLAAITDRVVTIEELAKRHKISRNHLMKVVQTLVAHSLVVGIRGRNGGLKLARPPEDIRIGTVVKLLEPDLKLVACLGDEPDTCIFSGCCRLTGAFRNAAKAFFSELDHLTLADVVGGRKTIEKRLNLAS
ncbi:RrF2 family transcriptional regulator [Brucella pseudogrignonensis]|uniref:RrF2 family transcriptional regulator n=1 Tax=Brucella pseudogrignonensis TaxID=419475 RepID=UPI003D9750BA